MMNNPIEQDKLYEELEELCEKLKQFYDIDKIKPYAVYVWGKHQDEDKNLFDITANEIEWYAEEKPFIKGSERIISDIQMRLKEMN